MRDLKVSGKLLISFAIVIVLTIAVSLAGRWGMRQIKKAADDIYSLNVVAIDALGLIRENFALQRIATREMLIYDSSSKQFDEVVARLAALEVEMERHIAQYRPTVRLSDDSTVFEQFLTAYYDTYGPYKAEFLDYATSGRYDDVINLIQTQAEGIVIEISGILQRAHALNVKSAEDSLRSNTELYDIMTVIETVVLIVVIVIVVTLVLYLTNLISLPLKHMSRALEYMGKTGHMIMEPELEAFAVNDIQRRDEIGMASQAIIRLLSHIWSIERALSQIAGGDFSVRIETLSDKDTMGMSVIKVAANLSTVFEQLKTAEAEAHAASSAKSAFLAQMSHEIRTPLNAIMGLATIIGRSPGNEQKTSASIKRIILSSKHLLNIVNDVLDMSKIESGKFEMTYEAFPLKASLSEVLSIITQRCTERSVTMVTNADEIDSYILVGDRMRINQILINLLGNAVKFTESPGEISLIIEILEETDSGVRIKFTVSDSGIGISREQQERLFMPFEQASSTTAQKYGGTGLGLSISRNLVDMMGGELKVESELGAGASFYFDIYLEKGVLENNVYEISDDTLRLEHKRILLVEDVEINREILCELLSDTGVTIDQAEDGLQAVEMFKNSRPGWYDLIYMDIQMPNMDGYEATRAIRSLNRQDGETIPIVAMTANAYKEDVVRCLQAGMDAHISKPIDLDTLLRSLRDYLLEPNI